MKVFISYSSIDREFVTKLAKDLRTANIDIWLDEIEIKVGDSLVEKISEGIFSTDFLLVVISKNSVKSNWVQKELSLAMSKEINGKRIVVLPIKIDDAEFPFFLRDKLYADFSSDNFLIIAKEFNKLLSAIQKKPDVESTECKNFQDEISGFESQIGESTIGALIDPKRDNIIVLKLPKRYLLMGFIVTITGVGALLSSFFFPFEMMITYFICGLMMIVVGGVYFYLAERMDKIFTIDKTLLLKLEDTNSVLMPFTSSWFKRYDSIKYHKPFKRLFFIEAVNQVLLFFVLLLLLMFIGPLIKRFA